MHEPPYSRRGSNGACRHNPLAGLGIVLPALSHLGLAADLLLGDGDQPLGQRLEPLEGRVLLAVPLGPRGLPLEVTHAIGPLRSLGVCLPRSAGRRSRCACARLPRNAVSLPPWRSRRPPSRPRRLPILRGSAPASSRPLLGGWWTAAAVPTTSSEDFRVR